MDAKNLAKIPLFADLSHKQLELVARWTDEIDVKAGTHLLQEGRLPHEFFLLLDGTVEVRKGDEHLANLGAGDFFGEIALVEHERRTASVIATTPVRALVMLGRDFDAMRADLPHVADRIHDAIRERMAR